MGIKKELAVNWYHDSQKAHLLFEIKKYVYIFIYIYNCKLK